MSRVTESSTSIPTAMPEPRLQVAGRRVFTSEDLQRLAKYFGVTLPSAEAAAESKVETVGV